jgi:6-pyruvoyltetrahydropterin/6-carboxytetrahydropterin synthase
MMIFAERYHDISAGHRVCGHENKCAHLHGHNYRVHFMIEGEQDSLGRVLDFSVIKALLCEWLEDRWDHKMLIWEEDPWLQQLLCIDSGGVQVVPFNPTAENMALYLLDEVGPRVLHGKGVRLVSVIIDETRKCSAGANLKGV